ncbi:cysteine--tRNA ligase [Candidatus Campbellbacteria bacterium RIFOXYC2_FULL_35_25]|uniref:Cysteine--tRNA ligase n=1 Tax=Candidatus Campbellbacteria bacterium RIFOXYC2_FULL_35_25 TaxID=1797582 RepID=A0A1F5EJ78_9BACT|nr:MAG: cysteine--tRNA ligase [Candidatus Campbellbacteria bacterium RIFOXYC2_FULL_35_25]
MALKIYNTLSKTKEEFKPLEDNKVRFYYCGPTVYKTQHIGGLRGNFNADSIRRSLTYLNYKVNFVSNYTDVGHLTGDNIGDADTGEDRMEISARLEMKTPKEIADVAIEDYERDTKELNLLFPTTRCRATDYIQEMVDMIQILLDKNFAYQTNLAIYFDVSKAKDYTRLSGQKMEEQIGGAGTGDTTDTEKRNPADFALWFFKKGKHENALQTWSSPWGEGFPGWHIECSAMSKKHLGDTMDIHMGGKEHISIHHTNEIAQSESANGVNFVNYWVHNEHLVVDNKKMSKSIGNVVMLKDIKEKGFDPLALRYFFLQAHYRSGQNFTWEALDSAQKGLINLYEQVASLGNKVGETNKEYKNKFTEKIEDDFNTPQALAVVSELLKSDLPNENKLATILDFDKVLGLNLSKAKEKIPQEISIEELSPEIQNLIKERQTARDNKDYQKSDELRASIIDKGYEVKDTPEGQKVFKKLTADS